MSDPSIEALRARIAQLHPVHAVGRVHGVDGTTIWVRGLADTACIGDRLRLVRHGGSNLCNTKREKISMRRILLIFV